MPDCPKREPRSIQYEGRSRKRRRETNFIAISRDLQLDPSPMTDCPSTATPELLPPLGTSDAPTVTRQHSGLPLDFGAASSSASSTAHAAEHAHHTRDAAAPPQQHMSAPHAGPTHRVSPPVGHPPDEKNSMIPGATNGIVPSPSFSSMMGADDKVTDVPCPDLIIDQSRGRRLLRRHKLWAGVPRKDVVLLLLQSLRELGYA